MEHATPVKTVQTCANRPEGENSVRIADTLPGRIYGDSESISEKWAARRNSTEEDHEEDATLSRHQEAERIQSERLKKFNELCPPLYRHPDLLAAMLARVPPGRLARVTGWQPESLRSGLLLHGPTGGFKTTMLFQLARRVMIEDGGRATWLNGEAMGREAAEAYGDTSKTAAWIKPYRTTKGWLFIDELFKGGLTPSLVTALFEIVEYRAAHLLPTVAATNATSERLALSARDPSAQETLAPLLRRIVGEEGKPGYFVRVRVPSPNPSQVASL